MTDLLYEREGAYEEGLEKGRAEGHAAGLAAGRAEGRTEGFREMAKALIQKGFPVETVVEVSGLSKEEILAL